MAGSAGWEAARGELGWNCKDEREFCKGLARGMGSLPENRLANEGITALGVFLRLSDLNLIMRMHLDKSSLKDILPNNLPGFLRNPQREGKPF